jgi:hypothetical protein
MLVTVAFLERLRWIMSKYPYTNFTLDTSRIKS